MEDTFPPPSPDSVWLGTPSSPIPSLHTPGYHRRLWSVPSARWWAALLLVSQSFLMLLRPSHSFPLLQHGSSRGCSPFGCACSTMVCLPLLWSCCSFLSVFITISSMRFHRGTIYLADGLSCVLWWVCWGARWDHVCQKHGVLEKVQKQAPNFFN